MYISLCSHTAAPNPFWVAYCRRGRKIWVILFRKYRGWNSQAMKQIHLFQMFLNWQEQDELKIINFLWFFAGTLFIFLSLQGGWTPYPSGHVYYKCKFFGSSCIIHYLIISNFFTTTPVWWRWWCWWLEFGEPDKQMFTGSWWL